MKFDFGVRSDKSESNYNLKDIEFILRNIGDSFLLDTWTWGSLAVIYHELANKWLIIGDEVVEVWEDLHDVATRIFKLACEDIDGNIPTKDFNEIDFVLTIK